MGKCPSIILSEYSTKRIVEIGGVELIDGQRIGCLFQSYSKPGANVHPLAFETHGLSDEFLSKVIIFKQMVAQQSFTANTSRTGPQTFSFLDW